MPDVNPGTIKYKFPKRKINIGVIICVMIILYFVAYGYALFFNKNSSFFEVVPGSTASSFDGKYTALILRSEVPVNSASTGYVNFFVGDQTPVYVGQQAYLIDKSGELSFRLNQAAQSTVVLNENDLTQLKDSLYNFKLSFRDSDYYETYHFKYQLESQILDLVNTSIFENNDIKYSGAYNIYNSSYAGIVMHYIDGFESMNVDSFDAASFKRNNYHKVIVKSNDYVNEGAPVYKVITSDNWYLVIQVSDPETFRGLHVVSIEFLKDNIKTDANFELIARGGNYYGVITLNKYMIRYAADRYTQIAFTDDTVEGLKVPITAVTSKQYLAVPEEFLIRGGDSETKEGFYVKTPGANGIDTVAPRYPEIILRKDGLCYIPQEDDALKNGDILIMENSNNEFTVGMLASLTGVYTDKSGKAVFRFVEEIGENNGFYIVKANTENGVRLFDQVYNDYRQAREQ